MKKSIISALLFSSLISASEAQLPLLGTENNWFVKATTKEKVILKGIGISNNSWGFYEWPVSDSLEKAKMNPLIRARELKPFVFTSEDVARIAQLDGNVVRYCFNDELFRKDNPKRQSNIVEMRSHISQLATRGIYSLVSMHINPGLDVHNDNFERIKPGNIRLKSPFESDSVHKIWRDVWTYVAENLQDINAVAGYELINEPKRPALADATEQKLVKCYVQLIDSIRLVDKRHIILIPEFNSREANPGEQYYNNETGQMVNDLGEQGTIWGRNWLQLPQAIDNMAYIAHIYDPYEFTSGKTTSFFDKTTLQNTIQVTADWVYAQNKPLFVTEYGVNYFHTMNGKDAKRTDWLKVTHDAFEANHISSTIFQYKDLITPWVKMDETFGLWMHYYDESSIKSVATGKVEYIDDQARIAAISSRIDPVLNEYFIENGKLKNISMVNNQSLFTELNRYFNSIPLGNNEINIPLKMPLIYASKETLFFTGLSGNSEQIPLKILSTEGKVLCDTTLHTKDGKTQLPLTNILQPSGKMILVSFGTNSKAQKVLLP